jgi:hypothetical protein
VRARVRVSVCVCVCVCACVRVCVFSGRTSFHILAHVEALCSKMCHPKEKDIAKFIVTANIKMGFSHNYTQFSFLTSLRK